MILTLAQPVTLDVVFNHSVFEILNPAPTQACIAPTRVDIRMPHLVRQVNRKPRVSSRRVITHHASLKHGDGLIGMGFCKTFCGGKPRIAGPDNQPIKVLLPKGRRMGLSGRGNS
ncbi:hypothetical protein D3C81_1697670 [compost metagenome]